MVALDFILRDPHDMAKPKTPAAEGSAEDQPKSKKKLVVIGLAAVLALGGGGYFAFGRGATAKQSSTETKPALAFVDVKEMMVNLAAEPNQERPRFLKLKVALEVRDGKVAGDVQPFMPRVEDIFQVFVRELRASDLEGSGGIHRLREELLRRVNIAVAPSRVDAVLFKEVIVQ